MYVTANLAVKLGYNAPPAGYTIPPTTMEVDYIRGYSLTAIDPSLNVLIERSATGGGIGFTQIASVPYGDSSFTDSPESYSEWFYRLRTTDGTNFSPYSAEFSAAPTALLETTPLISVQLGVAPNALGGIWAAKGIPIFSLPALSGAATGYVIFKGTSPGEESPLPLASGLLPGNYFDTNVSYGQTYYYTIGYENACGYGYSGYEYAITPQPNGNAAAVATAL